MKDSYVHIRINGELKQAAQDYAQETGRTLAGLIDWLLRQELKKAGSLKRGGQGRSKKMKTWYILVYDNGNRAIFEENEYWREQKENYGIDKNDINADNEAVKGIVESETEPTWDDLIYDSETGEYYLKDDIGGAGK